MPSLQEIEASGFAPEDFEQEDCEVWPENWPSFSLFCQLQTQWRTGMGGATGLDYTALYPLLDRMADDAEQWDLLFDDVQVMERAALSAMSAKD